MRSDGTTLRQPPRKPPSSTRHPADGALRSPDCTGRRDVVMPRLSEQVMTDDLILSGGQRKLLSGFKMPELTARDWQLEFALAELEYPHPDVSRTRSWPGSVRVRAALALEEIEELCRPAVPEVVGLWLLPIAAAVRRGPEDTEFSQRLEALIMATGEFPYVAWTVRKQHEAMRAFTTFPSVKEIIDLIEPPVRPLLIRRRCLRTIVAGRDTA